MKVGFIGAGKVGCSLYDYFCLLYTSIYLPHNYKENSVVYTGTHDNDKVVGWYETLSEDDNKFLEHYLKYSTIERTGTVHLDLISLALESRSDMVIIPLKDLSLIHI